MPYTLETYRSFVGPFLEDGYAFRGFDEKGALSDRAIVIRHDVDLSPPLAAEMAREEADLGIEITYCFVLTIPAYDLLAHVDRLEEIQALGHDVQLHFDPTTTGTADREPRSWNRPYERSARPPAARR